MLLKLRSKPLETFIKWSPPSHAPLDAHGMRRAQADLKEHSTSCPLFSALKGFLHSVLHLRLEVLARRGWGSPGNPRGWILQLHCVIKLAKGGLSPSTGTLGEQAELLDVPQHPPWELSSLG